jgi:hypothetical protein
MLGEAVIVNQAALPRNVPSPVIEGDVDQPIFEGALAGPKGMGSDLRWKHGKIKN